jgi:hypothetical protein
MPIQLMVPTSVLLGLVAYALIARWYVMPRLNRLTRAQALTPLLLFHSFRYIGLAFLIPGVTAAPLDHRFAAPAAYGDLLAALLALLAIVALRKRWTLALPIVWVFNVVGAVDLINAVSRGLLYTADGDLGATYFIPVMIVPALLVSHAMIFVMLLRVTRVRLATGGEHREPRARASA